jgi:hypothetical protein
MRAARRMLGPAIAILFTALPGSAQAAVVGAERVGLPSPTTSDDKSVTVTCPIGKRVLSAGADVTPGNGQVLIEDIRPDATLTSVTARAVEDETGTDDGWYVHAFAICAYPPPGLQRVALTTVVNSSDKSVPATCPAGKRVLGTGAEINTANGQVLLDGIRPSADLTAVYANALEDETGNDATWSLTAYAICANPVTGLQRNFASSALDSTSPKTKFAGCTAGKQLVGMGGEINSPNGQGVLDALFSDPASPNSAGAAAWEDDTGNASDWSLTTYAICAAGVQRVQVTSSTGSGEVKGASPICAPGRRATGLGADVANGYGHVGILEAYPADSVNWDAHIIGIEDYPPIVDDWSITGYGVCATPPPGYQIVSFETASGSPSTKATGVNCPAGKRVVGAGARIKSIARGGVTIDRIRPNGALTNVAVSAHEYGADWPYAWSLVAWGICADPLPGLELVTVTTPPDSDEVAVAIAACPAGKHLLGLGAELSPAHPQLRLDGFRPDAALRTVTATGYEDPTGTTLDWSATAYGICVSP